MTGDYEEEEEDEELEEHERAPRAPIERRDLTGLSLGWLAMLPLFAAYEGGLLETSGARRNTGERLIFLALEPLGDVQQLVRWAAVAAVALFAWLWTRSRGVDLRNGIARVVLEGGVLAIALGPLLVGILVLFDGLLPRLDASWDPQGFVPALAPAALVFGGAAWEELCFRVGAYGLLFVITRVLLRSCGLGARPADLAAEGVGLLGSSAAFAAAHLGAFTAWLGTGGAEFDPALFTWLVLAGILLGLVFRLRGPGVAAWTHGLFNLTLLLGVDPDVLL